MPPTPRPAGLVELPLSALQQRMWFICTAYTGDASPIVFLAYRLRGPLAVGALVRAVSAVVDRHESLRTRFVVRDGHPVQVIGPPGGLEMERIDLSGQPGAETRARALVAELSEALLDLDGGPLVRSRLIRLADDDHVWCLAVHHILADGVSMDILGRELATCYQAFRGGTAPPLPDLPIGYGDFALWQREGLDDDLPYWLKRLAGVPALELPTDLPRPPEKFTRAAHLDHQLDASLAEALARFARAERCTLFMVLLTALQALLGARSGQDDFCVGTPVSGRTHVELEPLVGLFSNMLALRCDLSGDPTFRQALRRTRTATIEALERQSVPFGHIVTELNLPRDPGRTQVFQAIFTLHAPAASDDSHGLAGVRTEPYIAGTPQTIHDLVLDIWHNDAGLAAGFRYDSGLFRPETITALASDLENLLRAAIADPDTRLSTLGGAA